MGSAAPAFIQGGMALGGSLLSSRASSSAAESTERSAERAAQTQWDMYNQTRRDQAPWRAAGEAALREQMALLGLDMPATTDPLYGTPKPVYDPPKAEAGGDFFAPGFFDVTAFGAPGISRDDIQGALVESDRGNYDQLYNQRLREWEAAQIPPMNAGSRVTTEGAAAMTPLQRLAATPGYQFQLDQGIKSLDRSAAARGLLRSGRQQRALVDYASNLADQTFDKYFNRLGVLSGTGQTANQFVNTAGLQTAGNVAGGMMQVGQANAANAINQGNNWANLINQGAQLYAMSNFNRQPQIMTNYGNYGMPAWNQNTGIA